MGNQEKAPISKSKFALHFAAASIMRAISGMPFTSFQEDYDCAVRELKDNPGSKLKFPGVLVSK